MSEEELKLSTAPTSKRFPTTNQAKACYMYYNSWHQCKYDYSDEEPQCAKLKGWAMSMCPVEWVRSAPLERPALACRAAGAALRLIAPRAMPPLPAERPPARALQVEKWEAQREAGTYPGPVPGEKKDADAH